MLTVDEPLFLPWKEYPFAVNVCDPFARVVVSKPPATPL